MGKASLMLRNIAGGSRDAHNQMSDLSAGIMLDDTLDDDRFDGRTFNYQLVSPPPIREGVEEGAGRRDRGSSKGLRIAHPRIGQY